MRSVLETDGYKFSMAEVGWPLRKETFYYTHRRGGPQILPVDVAAYIEKLIPAPSNAAYKYLEEHQYEMGAGFCRAILDYPSLVIRSLPKGATFFPGEPVFSVTGPSALVSWLEPLILQLNYRIQIATLGWLGSGREAIAKKVEVVTCQRQKEIILETMEDIKIDPPKIEVDEEAYYEKVLERAKALVKITGDANRVFEVGMRSVTCSEQHEIALRACKEAGITRTSNVFLAKKLDMIPVGTMGHEHVQRYGSDEAAFRAMCDRRPHRSSFLLDTFDTYLSGIPAAFKIICENRDRGDSIRYDSGDKVTQYLFAVHGARTLGIEPIHILEDGFDVELTKQFEDLRKQVNLPPEKQFYGYGGFLVADGELTRDAVSAAWKLCQTGPNPTMKFSNDAGKESLPGIPVIFRRNNFYGSGSDDCTGIIGQLGEKPPKKHMAVTCTASAWKLPQYPCWKWDARPHWETKHSPRMKELIEKMRWNLQKIKLERMGSS